MANKNTEIIINNYYKEKEETEKIRHDMKNHLHIIREMKNTAGHSAGFIIGIRFGRPITLCNLFFFISYRLILS